MTLLWLFALLWLLTWALAQAITPLALEWLKRSPGHPSFQPHRIVLVGALPWLIPLTATLAMAFSALAKSMGWVEDHCNFHEPHHPHFCFEHLPEMLLGHGHGHVVIAVALFSLFGLLSLKRWREHRQRSASLCSLTALSRGKGLLRVVEDDRLMAFAGGGEAPHIYLSQGLVDELSWHERRMVVAHEAAHLRHRDLSVGHFMEVLLLLHLSPFARELRNLWRNAIEVRADERVARQFGRTATAELILRLAKSSPSAPVPTAIGGGNLATRIQILLKSPTSSRKERPILEALIATGLLGFAAGLLANHHTLETLLGWVIRL